MSFKQRKSRNPIERLKTLSIGNPNLSIIGVCNKNVELLIHKEYDSVRVGGEWFRMDNNDICHIIKKIRIYMCRIKNYPLLIEK